MADPLRALTDAGVSIWLDDLNRERLLSGSLADPVAHQHVRGGDDQPVHLCQGHRRRPRL